jgi:hypothetical protein
MANVNENTIKKKISRSETTHAKNNENTHIVNTIIASLGTAYNPNNPLITAASMLEFESGFNGFMQELNVAISAEQTKVGEQIAAFKPVSKKVSKIMKAAAGQGLTAEFMGHLRSTSNRLNAVRVDKSTPDKSPAEEPSPPEGTNQRRASVSRRSYAGILESLDLLDEQLKGNRGYKPNETEYQSATVSVWVEGLRTTHHAALDARIATNSARNDRNAYAYHRATGILKRMNAVKAYVETILDKSDPRFKQLKKLRFVDYSK